MEKQGEFTRIGDFAKLEVWIMHVFLGTTLGILTKINKKRFSRTGS